MGFKRFKDYQEILRTLALILSGGATLLGLVLLIGLWRSGDRFLDQVSQLFTAPPPKPKVDVRTVVVQQVRDASELTTAVFVMEAVVPASQDQQLGRFVVGTTRLLYIAYGEVRAGVDLSQLKESDVQVDDTSLRLRLPPPRVLDTKIDVNRSTVYDYNRGFLGLGPDAAPQLQSLAQQEALRKVVSAACEHGVLDRANDRAKLVVTQLLDVTNDRTVTVEVQPPAPDACGAK